jgi:hypothetical protein
MQIEKELLRARETITRLEKEKLATVDRFRPATDQTIINLFKQLRSKAKALSNFLAKQMMTDLGDRKWLSVMIRNTWQHAYSPDIQLPDTRKDVDFRKQLWRLFVWRWLNYAIVQDPFSCYGGPENYPGYLGESYRKLFQNPHTVDYNHLST